MWTLASRAAPVRRWRRRAEPAISSAENPSRAAPRRCARPGRPGGGRARPGWPRSGARGPVGGTPSSSTIVCRAGVWGCCGRLAHREHRARRRRPRPRPARATRRADAPANAEVSAARSSGQRSRSFWSGSDAGVEAEHLEQRGEELRLDAPRPRAPRRRRSGRRRRRAPRSRAGWCPARRTRSPCALAPKNGAMSSAVPSTIAASTTWPSPVRSRVEQAGHQPEGEQHPAAAEVGHEVERRRRAAGRPGRCGRARRPPPRR